MSIFLLSLLVVILPSLQLSSRTAEAPDISLKLPEDLASENVQIGYFLTGSFGGYGSYVKPEARLHSYKIPSLVDGRAAREMKLIVYAPSCAIQTFTLHLGEPSQPEPEFECHRLRTIKFSGHIVPGELIRYGNAELIVTYFARWSHSFFGITDGMVVQIQLGRSSISGEGRFSVDLPDFTSSDTLPLYRENGSLGLTVRDATTWNPIGSNMEVEPADLRRWGQELKILSFYPNLTINFTSSSASN